MLNKSKKSAILLSFVTVLSFSLTSAALNILLPYLLTGDLSVIVADPERLSNPADMLALTLITLIALLGLTALTSYWLYRFFGPAYYGRRGAARWALFGFLLALLIKLPDWLFSPSLWWLDYVIYTLSAFIAFFVARWLLPLKRKGD